MAKELNPQQQKFVSEFLRTNNQKESAVAAGYAAGSASSKASQLMKHPGIIEAISSAQKAIRDEGIYNLKKAMDDADAAYEMARLKKNAAGMTAAATLKAKLAGLMVDRSEVKQTGFQIIIAGYQED